MLKEKGDEIIGKYVRVKKCEAKDHGDSEGCVCNFIGKIVDVGERHKTLFSETPSYYIEGMSHRVRRSEVTLVRNQQAAAREMRKHNCRKTLEANVNHVERLKLRMSKEGLTSYQAVIAILDANDVYWGPIANELASKSHWQEIRDRGEAPFWRGLFERKGFYEMVKEFDVDAAEKLKEMKMNTVAVVIIDHGVAEVFEA